MKGQIYRFKCIFVKNHGDMPRYFLKLAYKGSLFHGWQLQPNAVSVQGYLSEALGILLKQEVELCGCGRTDTGVHASCFYAHFNTRHELSAHFTERLPARLNSLLPKDIAVYHCYEVADDLHARFSALSRTYQYRIARIRDPFLQGLSFYYPHELDADLMQKGAQILKVYKDFSCFSRSHTQTKTNDCRIMAADWKTEGNLLVFEIRADRFLRNMVRAITGTLIDVGRGKTDTEEFRAIIQSGNRSRAGKSMPAEGLFLCQVEYPENAFTGR